MYLVPTKTLIVEAFRETFDAEHPVLMMRNIRVDIEFPVKQADFPGIWVNYDDTGELTVAGIGHRETIETDTGFAECTRWRFEGTVTLTAAALSSLERDTIYDEMIRVLAFGQYTEPTSQFRNRIENNDLIAIQPNFDDLRPSGDNAALGTPWQTQESVYEKSISFDLIGEFIGDPLVRELVPLGEVRVHPYVQGVDPVPNPPADPGYTATAWL